MKWQAILLIENTAFLSQQMILLQQFSTCHARLMTPKGTNCHCLTVCILNPGQTIVEKRLRIPNILVYSRLIREDLNNLNLTKWCHKMVSQNQKQFDSWCISGAALTLTHRDYHDNHFSPNLSQTLIHNFKISTFINPSELCYYAVRFCFTG